MDEFAVIVAGGSGSRMKSKLPKQFIEIGSLPILMHTISQFKKATPSINIILVLPESQIVTWELLCVKHKFSHEKLTIVKGGETRFQSCKNGIEAIKSDDALVAIHDGVRPFVSEKIIHDGFELAKEEGSAVSAIPSKDSARYLGTDANSNISLDRNRLRLVQTPQVFKLNILKKAYSALELPIFTDDASVVEHAGFPIHLYEGDMRNIKITTKEDIYLAELFLNEK
jgi:2-C-methyl-D-erythritol 4-phosphate cytidylyltransferase